jgi:hypothetical protein
MAVPTGRTPAQLPGSLPPVEPALGGRTSPVRGVVAFVEPHTPRPSEPVSSRGLVGPVPHSRDVGGRSLPRAYVARRRSSPKGIRAVTLAADDPTVVAAFRSIGARARSSLSTNSASGARAKPDRPQPISWAIRPRHLVYLTTAAIVVVIIVSATVGLMVGRSLTMHTAPISRQP